MKAEILMLTLSEPQSYKYGKANLLKRFRGCQII